MTARYRHRYNLGRDRRSTTVGLNTMHKLCLFGLFSVGSSAVLRRAATLDELAAANLNCNLENSLRLGVSLLTNCVHSIFYQAYDSKKLEGCGCLVEWKDWQVKDGSILYRTYEKRFECTEGLKMNVSSHLLRFG